MRKKLFLLSFVFMFGLVSNAAGETWVNWGADNQWNSLNNWNPATPTSTTDAEIDGAFTIGGAAGAQAPVLYDTQTAVCKYLIVGSATAATAEFQMLGGTLNVHDRVYMASTEDTGAVGKMVLRNGTVNMLASDPKFYVGNKGISSSGVLRSKGYFEMSGGTINNVGKFYLAGDSSSTAPYGEMTMSGGTINVDVGSDRVRIGGKGGTGKLTMSGGTINCTDDFGVNDEDAGGGYGYLYMTGGYISTVDRFRLNYKGKADSVAEVYLYGGIIDAGRLTINDGAAAGATASMDITYGTMRLSGDRVSEVQALEDAGLLTGYGGVGDVLINYHVGLTRPS